MNNLFFEPPLLYFIIAFVLVVTTLLWLNRKRIYKEIKRWQFRELNLGPIKLERRENDALPDAKGKNQEKGKKKETLSTSQSQHDVKSKNKHIDSPVNSLPEKLYTNLVGRDKEIEGILNSLRDPSGKKLIGIYGMGGVGKSSLAREAAGRVVDQKIFSSAWWTTAKTQSLDILDELSSDKTVGYETIITRLASWLGLGSELRNKQKIQEYEEKIQKNLADYNLLFILDNLETSINQDEIATRFAKVLGKTNCKSLLTSREAWQNIPNTMIEPIQLQGLNEQDGVELMRSIARDQKNSRVLSATSEQLMQVTRSVKNMPLALKLVVGILRNHDLSSVLSNIEQIQSPKIIEMYDYLFANSWRTLNLAEKNMLIVLSQFDEDEGANSQLLRKSDVVETDKFESIIDNLVKMSLIEVSSDNNIQDTRYILHPLTLNFIRSK